MLAPTYQLPELQDVAHHTRRLVGLSRIAAGAMQWTNIFCGVNFSGGNGQDPEPRQDRGDSCTIGRLFVSRHHNWSTRYEGWKAEYDDPVVVSFVNETAEVKAESDICCTPSNAAEMCRRSRDEGQRQTVLSH